MICIGRFKNLNCKIVAQFKMESINNTTFASCFFGIVHPTAKTQLVPNTGIPMGFEQKPLQPNGPGIVGLVVVPMAGVSHKIIFVWDHMPFAMTPLPWSMATLHNLYKAVAVARSIVQSYDTNLYQTVQRAYLALHDHNIVHACRELFTAKDRAVMDGAPEFVVCILTFASLYGLRIVGVRAILFDDLCSVASAEWARV